jgi:diguanylate cyclase (GGDEF)-like protein
MIAERIRALIEALADRRVTASFGVATMTPTESNTPDQLIAAADACLYRAKHEGRNCVRG